MHHRTMKESLSVGAQLTVPELGLNATVHPQGPLLEATSLSEFRPVRQLLWANLMHHIA
jgi:hypothetical protein